MAGLGNIAAPQRIVCSVRERFLHLHSLRGQKAGLSADCEFISPRFRSRSEWPVRRAAQQNREVALKGSNGPFMSIDTNGGKQRFAAGAKSMSS
jgi:hypothetical protein